MGYRRRVDVRPYVGVILMGVLLGLVALSHHYIHPVVRAHPAGDVSSLPPALGTVTTAGVSEHGALNWHQLGYDGRRADGTRLKVGIIDSGFKGFTAAAASGELPAAPGQ